MGLPAQKTPGEHGETNVCAENPRQRQYVPRRVDDLTDDEKKNFIFITPTPSDPVWERLGDKADELVFRLYHRLGCCPQLTRRGSVFLVSVALLADKVGDAGEWLQDAIEATESQKGVKTPPAYLRTCLRGSYAAATCKDPSGFEAIVAQLRRPVQRFLTISGWHPDEAYDRRRPPTPAESRAKEIELERQQADSPSEYRSLRKAFQETTAALRQGSAARTDRPAGLASVAPADVGDADRVPDAVLPSGTAPQGLGRVRSPSAQIERPAAASFGSVSGATEDARPAGPHFTKENRQN